MDYDQVIALTADCIAVTSVLLNVGSGLAVAISRTVPTRQKVCFTAVLLCNVLICCLLLFLHHLPIHAYRGEDVYCEISLRISITLALFTSFVNLLITTERLLIVLIPFNFDTVVTWTRLLFTVVLLLFLSTAIVSVVFYDGFASPEKCQFIVCGNAIGYIVCGFIFCAVFVTLMVMYVYIFKEIRKLSAELAVTMVGSDTVANAVLQRQVASERRTTITVALIVGIFGLSYSPLGIEMVYAGLVYPGNRNTLDTEILVLSSLYLTNTFAGPILYIWRLKACRAEMVTMFKKCFLRCYNQSVASTTRQELAVTNRPLVMLHTNQSTSSITTLSDPNVKTRKTIF